MNPHERAFVESFIQSDRRERFLAALANPKKRAIFNRELHHPRSNFLLSKYVERVVPSQHYTRFIMPKLTSMGATDDCWVFGNFIDGRWMKLAEGVGYADWNGDGHYRFLLAGQTGIFRERRWPGDSP